MGGAVSSGRDNDELVDNLVGGGYIRTRLVERVFRELDRADYMVPMDRGQAYKDVAWRNGALHLSAPCIYSEVMEALQLKPGLSFLNLGSGTGYLSVLVGLIIGSSGTSHGVEVHSGVVDYSNRKLRQFLDNTVSLDEFDFCAPKFYCGNALCLAPLQAPYDRVYVGAGVLPKYENYFKQLIKVKGVLVMPLGDTLVQITRDSDTEWSSRRLLNVSFALLQAPLKEEAAEPLKLDGVFPAPLVLLARACIRRAMLGGVCRRNPELREPEPRDPPAARQRARPRRICIPLDPDTDDENLNELHDMEPEEGGHEMNALLSLVLSMGSNRVGGSLRFDLDPQEEDHLEVLIDDMENASSDGNGDRANRRAEALFDETRADVNDALAAIQQELQEPSRPSFAGASSAARHVAGPAPRGTAVPGDAGVTRSNGNVDHIDGEATLEMRPAGNGPVGNSAGRVEVDTEDVPLRPAPSDTSEEPLDTSESDSKPSTSGETGTSAGGSSSGSSGSQKGGRGEGGGGDGGGKGRWRRRGRAPSTPPRTKHASACCVPQPASGVRLLDFEKVSIYFGSAGEYSREDVVVCSPNEESARTSEDVQMEQSSSDDEDVPPSCSKVTKRQKLDSGIGDATCGSSSGATTPSTSDSKTDESDSKTGGSSTRTDPSATDTTTNSGRSFRRRRSRGTSEHYVASAGAASGTTPRRPCSGPITRRGRISLAMKRAVKELPLPYPLKKYVNLGRTVPIDVV